MVPTKDKVYIYIYYIYKGGYIQHWLSGSFVNKKMEIPIDNCGELETVTNVLFVTHGFLNDDSQHKKPFLRIMIYWLVVYLPL